MMIFKKHISIFAAFTTLFSCSTAFANGVLPEDKEIICDTVEKLVKDKNSDGYCQFIYSSPSGELLLRDSLRYALEQKRYSLAEKLISLFGELGFDINKVEGLDFPVVKTGQEYLYEKLQGTDYKISTPENCRNEHNLLYAAVCSENIRLVEQFLKKGFNPNSSYPYDFHGYPLHKCLATIIQIADSNNAHGFESADNRERVEKIIKIANLLCEYGASPFFLSGKWEDQSAFDILDMLNPKREVNCYDKLDFYSSSALNFCEKIYSDLNSIISKAAFGESFK